jgi:hypothetical protein
MTDVVAKDFKTVNRRFKADADISPADVEGAVTYETWKDRGFIKSAAPAFTFKSVEPESPPAAPPDGEKRPRR